MKIVTDTLGTCKLSSTAFLPPTRLETFNQWHRRLRSFDHSLKNFRLCLLVSSETFFPVSLFFKFILRPSTQNDRHMDQRATEMWAGRNLKPPPCFNESRGKARKEGERREMKTGFGLPQFQLVKCVFSSSEHINDTRNDFQVTTIIIERNISLTLKRAWNFWTFSSSIFTCTKIRRNESYVCSAIDFCWLTNARFGGRTKQKVHWTVECSTGVLRMELGNNLVGLDITKSLSVTQ